MLDKCPICGTPRKGKLGYCANCEFVFPENETVRSSQPTKAVSTAVPSGWRIIWLSVAIGSIGIALAIYILPLIQIYRLAFPNTVNAEVADAHQKINQQMESELEALGGFQGNKELCWLCKQRHVTHQVKYSSGDVGFCDQCQPPERIRIRAQNPKSPGYNAFLDKQRAIKQKAADARLEADQQYSGNRFHPFVYYGALVLWFCFGWIVAGVVIVLGFKFIADSYEKVTGISLYDSPK